MTGSATASPVTDGTTGGPLPGGTGEETACEERVAVGPAAPALLAEAAILARATHPGVVELVSVTVDGRPWDPTVAPDGPVGEVTVRTTRPGRPLTGLGSLPTEEVAGLVAALATTLADLADMGIHHGNLTAEAILVDGTGTPRLRRFAPGGGSAAGDVAALGRLLTSLVGPATTVPRGWWRPVRDGAERARALALLGDRCQSDDPTLALSALDLAAAVTTVVPDARLPAGARGTAPPGSRGRSPRWVAAGVLAVVVAGAATRLGAPGRPGDPPPPSTPTTAGYRTATVLDDGTITHEGGRYGIGGPGDEVIVGDWSCDGTATPALLDRRRGLVFVFGRWPDDGPLSAPAATTAAAGERLGARAGRPCGPPVLIGADGAARDVPVPAGG